MLVSYLECVDARYALEKGKGHCSLCESAEGVIARKLLHWRVALSMLFAVEEGNTVRECVIREFE